MVFAILTFALGKPKGIPDWLRHSTLARACILLVLANAATALLTALVCLAMYPAIHRAFDSRGGRRYFCPLWIPLFPVFALAAFAVIGNFALVAEAMTKCDPYRPHSDMGRSAQRNWQASLAGIWI